MHVLGIRRITRQREGKKDSNKGKWKVNRFHNFLKVWVSVFQAFLLLLTKQGSRQIKKPCGDWHKMNKVLEAFPQKKSHADLQAGYLLRGFGRRWKCITSHLDICQNNWILWSGKDERKNQYEGKKFEIGSIVSEFVYKDREAFNCVG